MAVEPIVGKPVRFPPGYVAVRLGPEHRSAYRRLYGRYQSYLAGLPVLRERDFDGRAVKMTAAELAALNAALAAAEDESPATPTAFQAQERGRTRLFKRLQFLS